MRTILVADKDNKVRNIVRLVFEHMGYEVVAVWSGADAILKAKEIKPDIVLADTSLSDKDGYEISREIKNDLFLKNTPVVLLTASPETFDKTKAIKAYADDFIIKPFEGREITKKVEFLTNRNRKRAITYKMKFLINRNRKKTITYIDVMLLVVFMAIAPIVYKGVNLNLLNVKSKLKWLYTPIKDLGNINLSKIESKPMPADEREKKEVTYEIKENVVKELGLITETSSELRQWGGEMEASQPGKMETPEELKKAEEGKSLGAKGKKTKEKKGPSFKEVRYRLLKEIQMKVEAKEASIEEEIEPSQLKAQGSPQPEVGARDIERKEIEPIRSTLWNSSRSVLEPDGVNVSDVNSLGERKGIQKSSDYLNEIRITSWSFYTGWNGVGIIHHVTIENLGDIAYKDIKVRINYYSNVGTAISWKTGILPIIVPPHSKETYLKGGTPLGVGSSGMYAGNVEVLGVTPVK
jgi:DNA-binding response OmpR family regulator